MCGIIYLEIRVLKYKMLPQGKHVILTYEGKRGQLVIITLIGLNVIT